MAFKGVSVNQINGGLGRKNPTDDGVCLLIIGGAVAATGLAIKKAVELLTVENAESIGINASFDDTNNILAHHHIDEFFRLSPNGNLFVVLDDDTITAAEIKAILTANQQIKAVGFVRNAAAAVVDFPAYVAGYQTMVNELRVANRNIASVLVEGNEFVFATLISAYVDTRATYISKNVSVVIAQDPVIRAIKTEHETYAAIGSALGMLSVRSVNENLGSVDLENKPSIAKAQRDYPLTDIARKRWLTSGLQDGKDFNTLSATEITALNDKGYVFVGFYNGYPGFYFSDSHTAIDSASDYSRIENNRVWDKAADLIRKALLPRVKSNLLIDPISGFIRDAEAAELETIALNAVNQMTAAGEISGAGVYIDPQQDLSSDADLKVKGQVVFNKIIHKFDVDLGLTNKLS